MGFVASTTKPEKQEKERPVEKMHMKYPSE